MTQGDEPENKKRKVERLQCEFFISGKNRRCGMSRKPENKYCAEHMILQDDKYGAQAKGERIECPVDSRHTIWAKDLNKHIKKCNGSKSSQIKETWFSENLNITKKDEEESEIPELDLNNDKEIYTTYIKLIKEVYAGYESLQLDIKSHSGLQNRLDELTNQKHAIQQSSLIGHLSSLDILSSEHSYLEFGCGKGELSRFVNIANLTDSNKSAKGFGFIDRGVNRMKMDPKIVKDCEGVKASPPFLKRSRMDIKDLSLDSFVSDFPEGPFVGISKHLCGAATDLTLQCILNSKSLIEEKRFGGLVVAMCCRHVCSWDMMLSKSKEYLKGKGFDRASFRILTKMASWAVCGRRAGMKDEDVNGHISGLSVLEREEMGNMARRIIDESRLFALKQDFEARIFWYVERETSLENVCLVVKLRE